MFTAIAISFTTYWLVLDLESEFNFIIEGGHHPNNSKVISFFVAKQEVDTIADQEIENQDELAWASQLDLHC